MSRRLPRAFAMILTISLLAQIAFSAAAATIVGQTGEGVYVNGLAVPSGTTLIASSELSTSTVPAVVHLNDGRALVLSASSRARLAEGENGAVRVAVDEGLLALRHGEETIMIASNESLSLDEPVGEGAKVEDCSKKATAEERKACEEAAAAAAAAAAGSSGASGGAGGMGPLATTAIVVGGLAVGYLIYEEVDEDEDPSSP